MENCIFCKIARGEVPSEWVFEDEHILAFRDVDPAAPVHILLIPKEHIGGVDELCADNPEHSSLVAKLILTAGELALKLGLGQGWRLVTNVREHGGQTVRHLHIHLLGGTYLGDFGAKHEFRE
jgi:histidine triad (HIT) family protein